MSVVVTWVYPVVFLPYEFVKTILRKATGRRQDSEAAQAACMSGFQRAYNERMSTCKEELIFATVSQASAELGRPVRVLEFGSGSAANFAFYPRQTMVACLDPNPACEGYLRKSAEDFPDVIFEAFYVSYGEDMKGINDNSMDVVVSSLTLCTVSSIDQCLKEIIRILKPVS